MSVGTPQVLASVLAGAVNERPLTAKCRFDPTVQNHPPDVKCRVFRSGLRPTEAQQIKSTHRDVGVRSDCRSGLPEGVDGQGTRKEWTSSGTDGCSVGPSGDQVGIRVRHDSSINITISMLLFEKVTWLEYLLSKRRQRWVFSLPNETHAGFVPRTVGHLSVSV